MKGKMCFLFGTMLIGSVILTDAFTDFEKDVVPTSLGDMTITFVGHGTLMFSFDGKIIHVDPVSRYADYNKMPKADIVLVTHHHGDHLDEAVIKDLKKEGTAIVLTTKCQEEVKIDGPILMANGDTTTVQGIKIEAVPAYNIKHMRSENMPFHPKGEGNGYIMTFGDKRVYVAGDTENTPEMKALTNIAVAFLPMNLPYTMTPEMVADAAKAFKPKILYPYHFGNTDTKKLVSLLKSSPKIEVRIRNLRQQAMIDSYSFGRISINQKIYTKDVIILPDRVQANWWRKAGHFLQLEDIESEVEEANPEAVVVGKGKFGVMEISSDVKNYLRMKNIALHTEKSDKAAEIFNKLISSGQRVIGAFHLSC